MVPANTCARHMSVDLASGRDRACYVVYKTDTNNRITVIAEMPHILTSDVTIVAATVPGNWRPVIPKSPKKSYQQRQRELPRFWRR